MRQLYLFLLGFLLLNLIQAGTTNLTGDEALYWVYSRNPAAGYHDHPPAVAWIIALGEMLGHGEIFTRLVAAILNFLTLCIIAKLIKIEQWWHYALIVASIPIAGLYGFIATPDAPLIFSAACYLLVWKAFLQLPNRKNAIFLGLTMAMMMWSKYHGFFIILFTLLPVRKMWFNKWFWMAATLGVVLFIPHLYWQVTHDFQTIKFHLFERNNDRWNIAHISGYLAGQLMVFNPVIAVLAVICMTKFKAQNDYDKSMKWLIAGIFGLFLFYSTRGRVEPHWTSFLIIPILYLLFESGTLPFQKKWFFNSISILMISTFMVRAALIVDFLPTFKKEFFENKRRMNTIHDLAGEDPVCFINSYQNPSLYMYYFGSMAHSLNVDDGGKNQYDDWDYADAIDHHPFLFVADYDAGQFDSIYLNGFDLRILHLNDFPLMHKLKIIPEITSFDLHQNDSITWNAMLINNNHYTVFLPSDTAHLQWLLEVDNKAPNEENIVVNVTPPPVNLMPGDTAMVKIKFAAPVQCAVNRKAFIAIRYKDFPPAYQSGKIELNILP
jgi:hypothetical protein